MIVAKTPRLVACGTGVCGGGRYGAQVARRYPPMTTECKFRRLLAPWMATTHVERRLLLPMLVLFVVIVATLMGTIARRQFDTLMKRVETQLAVPYE